ncbi:MAG: hypothetical protein WCT05_02485 [Lentisphaeria bacterium]
MLKHLTPEKLFRMILVFGLTFSLQLLTAQNATPPANPAQNTDQNDEDFDEEEEEDTPQTVDWRLERDEILKEIKKYVDETVAKTVTRDTTTRFISVMIQRGREIPKMGNFRNLKGVDMAQWKWSIPEPKAPIEDIVKTKTEEIVQQVHLEFPDTERKKFDSDAQAKYEMFKFGERISIELRQGLGTNTDVSGIFHAITSERILVGKRYVSRRDLDPDTEARFYKEQNAIRIEEYVRRENDLYDAKIASRIDDLKRQELPPAFHTSGYVPDPDKTGSSIRTSKADFWIARRTLHTKIFKILTQQAKEKLTAIETPKRFAERGYIQAPNETEEIEWMPQLIAEQIKLAKEAAQAQSQQPQNPGEMPYPNPMQPMPPQPLQ